MCMHSWVYRQKSCEKMMLGLTGKCFHQEVIHSLRGKGQGKKRGGKKLEYSIQWHFLTKAINANLKQSLFYVPFIK